MSQPARLDDYRDLHRLRDGASVALVGDAVELRDPDGALLIRYRDGHAEVYAPRGDVTFGAPFGRVVLRARDGVTIDAGEELTVEAREAGVKLDRATVIARQLVTSANEMAVAVERYQLTAERIVEQARDAFRDVRGLMQERLGRVRTLVEGTRTLHTERNVMVSKADTTIDGERILLG